MHSRIYYTNYTHINVNTTLQEQDELKEQVDDLSQKLDDLGNVVSTDAPSDTASDNELQRQLDDIEVASNLFYAVYINIYIFA